MRWKAKVKEKEFAERLLGQLGCLFLEEIRIKRNLLRMKDL